jgi:NAD-dependent dihydropyrimidine dehydrogenase PreA subunit
MFVVDINEDLCTGCNECVSTCPVQMLAIKNSKAVLTSDDCLGCQSCALVCPVEAIKITEF